MKNATLEKEIRVQASNEQGIAGRLNKVIAQEAKTNIKTFLGWEMDSQAHFAFITNDNQKVEEVLRKSEFNKYEENEVVVIRTTDQTGSLSEITNKISNAGVNIKYLFTTTYDSKPAVVINSEDNRKVLSLFN